MASRAYQDLLWDFVELDARENLFLLRLFSDEDELYRTRYREPGSSGFPVTLPVRELFGTSDGDVASTRRRVTSEEARRIGTSLWRSLPSEVTHGLKERIDSSATPLRLKISSSAPHVANLPWEWLADVDMEPVALLPGVRLARSVPAHLPTPRLTLEPPLRVLLVLTNPKDERLLDAEIEMDAVRRRLILPDYEVDVCWEPTIDSLQQHLNGQPHIVHYIGHAGISTGDGNLILHDSTDRTYWLSGSMLGELLPPTVRLMCLSTCFTVPNYQVLGLSRLATGSRQRQLPTMVANQYPLDEQSVRIFWAEFYSKLIDLNGNVNEALHHGRTIVAGKDPHFADWASFTLVIRDKTAHPFRLAPKVDSDPDRSAPTRMAAAPETDLAQRQAVELQAQMASEFANDLAEQVRVLGDDAPPGLIEIYEREAKRASSFRDRLVDDDD